MRKPLGRMLGLNPGMRAWIIAPPLGYLEAVAPLPKDLTVSSRANGMYPFVQVFATRLSEISRFTARVSKHAAPNAENLSRDVIREVMNGTGWRAVSIMAIDEVWSALRFRPARPSSD